MTTKQILIILTLIISILLISGCNSSFDDCQSSCKSLSYNDFDFKHIEEKQDFWRVWNSSIHRFSKEYYTYNETITNYEAINNYCFKQCNK